MNQANRLKISSNQRFLIRSDGSPFSWFADTAWELFHRLTREDAGFYLAKRKEQGFTLIQAVVLAEFEGIRQPNVYGNSALVDQDPAQPNEAYFCHVDWIVEKANSLGLVIGMLPTWGDKWGKLTGMVQKSLRIKTLGFTGSSSDGAITARIWSGYLEVIGLWTARKNAKSGDL
jgi:hypothetical protein